MKAKIVELDILRAVSILAVLIIHAAAQGTMELSPGSVSLALYLGINKLGNFAVPMFIFISGLALFYRYFDTWIPGEAVRFYAKRIRYILIPYVLWSLFYYFYYQMIYSPGSLSFHPGKFAMLLLWGDASYHLYFIRTITEFYLLFPILVTLAKTFRPVRHGLFLLGVLVQCAVYCWHYFVEPVPQRATLCFTYFGLFTLGGWIGIHFEFFRSWLRRHIFWILPLCLLTGIAFSGMFLLRQEGIVFKGVWYELMFHLYAMLVGVSFIWIAEKLLKKASAFSSLLISLGTASFLIYLMHPAILTALHEFVGAPGALWEYHAFTASCLLLILILPWVAFIVLRRRKYAWLIMGRG